MNFLRLSYVASYLWLSTTHARKGEHLRDYQYGGNSSRSSIECIYSHGIADTGAQAHKYVRYPYGAPTKQNAYYTIEVPVYFFDYPDATRRFWRVNFWRTSFGQHNEIQTLKTIIERRRRLYSGTQPPVRYILYGVSRGASTILNYVGQIHQHSRKIDIPSDRDIVMNDISALVLESPFDHVETVARAFARRAHLSRVPGVSSLIHSIMATLFRLYRKHGVNPLCSVGSIPSTIPILIICSKEDRLVPWESSHELYKKLRETGHPNTHILVLDSGKHAQLFSQRYHEVVHAFYRHYGLPHNTRAAVQGEQFFASCQPLSK